MGGFSASPTTPRRSPPSTSTWTTAPTAIAHLWLSEHWDEHAEVDVLLGKTVARKRVLTSRHCNDTIRLSDGSGEGELKGHAVASAGEARRVSGSRPCGQKHLARPAVRKSLTAQAAGPNIPTVGNSSSRESTSDREGSESRPEAGADGGLAPLRCLTTELLVKNERAWCSQAARLAASQ